MGEEIKADWPVKDLNPRPCPPLWLCAETAQITRQEAHKDDTRSGLLGNTRKKKKKETPGIISRTLHSQVIFKKFYYSILC